MTKVKKATRIESRRAKNLWGLMKPSKAAATSSAARRARKQPPRGFGARPSARDKGGVMTKILRVLKLKKD